MQGFAACRFESAAYRGQGVDFSDEAVNNVDECCGLILVVFDLVVIFRKLVLKGKIRGSDQGSDFAFASRE